MAHNAPVDASAVTTDFEGERAVALASGDLEATFLPGLGMLGVSLRHRGQELLGQRRGVAAYREHGKTMGIPFLYPWANRLAGDDYALAGCRMQLPADSPLVHRDGQGLPMHGLLSGSPHWDVTLEDGAALRATLDFGAHPDLLEAFPVPHEIELRIALDAGALTVVTEVRPTGADPLPVSFGYHPYVTVPGLERDRWRVGLPRRRRLAVDERQIPTGEAEPALAEVRALGDRALDDGFDGLAPGAEFTLAGGGRRVAVVLVEGYPAAQVFAPASEDLICFEPMTAPANALRSGRDLPVVAPGERYRATFAIAVREDTAHGDAA